jgi:hypothetical protein
VASGACEILDYQQVDAGQLADELRPRAGGFGFGQVLRQVER